MIRVLYPLEGVRASRVGRMSGESFELECSESACVKPCFETYREVRGESDQYEYAWSSQAEFSSSSEYGKGGHSYSSLLLQRERGTDHRVSVHA